MDITVPHLQLPLIYRSVKLKGQFFTLTHPATMVVSARHPHTLLASVVTPGSITLQTLLLKRREGTAAPQQS